MGSALVLKAKYHMKEKSQHETRKTLGDKEKKMTLSSVDMAEAHALLLRKAVNLCRSRLEAINLLLPRKGGKSPRKTPPPSLAYQSSKHPALNEKKCQSLRLQRKLNRVL